MKNKKKKKKARLFVLTSFHPEILRYKFRCLQNTPKIKRFSYYRANDCYQLSLFCYLTFYFITSFSLYSSWGYCSID